jgi:ubiquinone/menaquinone biosynthesis C-methylase UbiE
VRARIRARTLDWIMRQLNDLRPSTVGEAEADVLEVGFGTGLNLDFYPDKVSSLVALEPDPPEGLTSLERRLARAPFPVERCALPADTQLPFDAGRFDCVVSTWTLCSIPEVDLALAEMRRVLRPGGRLLFIEHGRAPSPSAARWQDRLNPLWLRITGGCNMNRAMDRLVEEAGFELVGLERFRAKGPSLLAHMYRGVAKV